MQRKRQNLGIVAPGSGWDSEGFSEPIHVWGLFYVICVALEVQEAREVVLAEQKEQHITTK